jgi:hypothetical protein
MSGPFSAISMIIKGECTPSLGGRDTLYVVTSPNAPSCPILKFGVASVRARKDGRYYSEDFTSSPQLFTEEYGYNCVVRRKPSDPSDALQLMWWIPSEADHVEVRGSMFAGLGTLAPQHLDRFKALQDELITRAIAYQRHRAQHSILNALERGLRHCFERLSSMPCTFKDLVGQVAEYQRSYLDVLSFLDFYDDFSPRWTLTPENGFKVYEVDLTRMGAYTTQPNILQWLYEAGIPVWFVQQVESIEAAEKRYPNTPKKFFYPTSSADDWEVGGEKDPFPDIFVGPPGVPCQAAVKRMGSFLANVADLSGDPLDSHVGPAQREKGRDRPLPCKSIMTALWMTS